MTVKHRSDDPPGRELVRVVHFYRIRVVFLKTRRGVLTANGGRGRGVVSRNSSTELQL
jgi:hypothetical protein